MDPAAGGPEEGALAYAHYERLGAQDASFLDLDDESVHMHTGAVALFEGGPLLGADGGLDIERIREFVLPALRRSQRLRQRLETVPLVGRRIWVDDPRFNLDYHLRHTALPEPGDLRLLKRLAGRVLSQKLDRGKPLWELWFVEGLEGQRFAVISKVHQCMVDGVSGTELLAGLLGFEPEEPGGDYPRWLPRPAPGRTRLLLEELRHRASLPARLLRGGRSALRHPARSIDSAADAARSLRETLTDGLGSASPTPLNEPIGPYRRFDWTRVELDALREIQDKLGASVDDVVLAVVTGALRSFLERRGVGVEGLDFRALLPQSVGRDDEPGRRMAFRIAPLPVDEPSPRQRLERVVKARAELEHSRQLRGGELVEQISDWTFPGLLPLFMRLSARQRAYNVVVAQASGPQQPAELLGARLREIYPVMPLFPNQSLGIALFAYDGALHWGFNCDWDAVPDLHEVVESVQLDVEALRKL